MNEVVPIEVYQREQSKRFESEWAEREPEPLSISATPYTWPNPSAIPRRQWLYGRHLIRGFISVTVAPGGVGKSSLVIADALAMISGKSLLGSAPAGKLNVWIFNGEDPREEIERRVAATAVHYSVNQSDCSSGELGSLYVDSGRDTSLVVARQSRDGVAVIEPVVNAIVREIKARKIDVLVIDPFVSSHGVQENDNNAIDTVAKLWARVAHETGCAVDLVHHSRKTGGLEVTAEHARGAVALIAAARSVRVLNTMTQDDGDKSGIEDNPRLYFNVENGKSNLAPPPSGKFWFKMQSVDLGNGDTLTAKGVSVQIDGDQVGVVTPWRWPDPLEGVVVADILKAQEAVAASEMPCRADAQAADWVGHVIGKALCIETSTKTGREKARALLAIWIKTGMFIEVDGVDAKRKKKRFVEVGEWANT